MNIYFSCSITGGRAEEKTYQAIVQSMLNAGFDVPTAHLSETNVVEVEKVVDPQDIFERDMKWLENCDAVVAEVTSPSHGVGYEIAYALTMDKPVLCVYKAERKISMIISGNNHKRLVKKSYESDDQAVSCVSEFLRSIQ